MKSRIVLRKFNKADSVEIFKWAKDPVIIKYFGRSRTDSAPKEYQRLMSKIKNYGRIILMIATKNKKSIGYVWFDVDKKNKKAQFSISIGEKDYRGRGYGREATEMALDYGFSKLGLNRIFLRVLPFNLTAINLYKKSGFKKEGLLREDIYVNGKYQNFIVMGILKKEYKKRK